jgi:hypothetical protein
MIHTNKIMPVENFLERMNALVEELKAHPKVTLLNYHVPAPATEQDFADVEAHIGMPLPKDIKTFYRQCNGLQLRWVHKDNWNVDQKLWTEFMEGPFDYEEIKIEKGIEGIVNILPVKDVFFRKMPFKQIPIPDDDLPGPYQLLGVDYDYKSLSSIVWNFDLHHYNYDFSLCILSDRSMATLVMMQEDTHRDPSPGIPLFTFAAYLDLIFLKKGCADARIFNLAPGKRNFNLCFEFLLGSTDGIGNPQPYDLNYPYHRKK